MVFFNIALLIFVYLLTDLKNAYMGCAVTYMPAVLILVILHRTCPSAETLVAANLFYGLQWFNN